MRRCTRCGTTSILPFGWGKYSAYGWGEFISYKSGANEANYCPGCNKIFRKIGTHWEAILEELNSDCRLNRVSGESAEKTLSRLLEEIENNTKEQNFDFGFVISSIDSLDRLERTIKLARQLQTPCIIG